MNLTDLLAIVQLVGLELLLSVDQVAVIGARVKELPDTLMGDGGSNRFTRWFYSRKQRDVVRVYGLLWAVVIRLGALYAAAWLIQYPVIRVIGGLYLVVMGLKHLAKADQQGEDDMFKKLRVTTFWGTVGLIGIMDGIFAIDNVLTSVGIAEDMLVIIFGGVVGIITLFFGSGYAIRLMEKDKRYEVIAYALLIEIGTILLIDAFGWAHIHQWQKIAMSMLTIASVVVYIRFTRVSDILCETALTTGQVCGNLYEIVHNVQGTLVSIVTFRFKTAGSTFVVLIWNFPELFESLLRLLIGLIRIPKRIRLMVNAQTLIKAPVE